MTTRQYGTIETEDTKVRVSVVGQRVFLAAKEGNDQVGVALTREQAWGIMSWMRDAVYDLDAQAWNREEDRCVSD